jgi:hypothetical protein
MNAIKEILLNGGCITAAHHQELKNDFPNLIVCIKWGQAQRELTSLKHLDSMIAMGEARGDYVREVFIPVGPLHKLRSVFGVTEEDQRAYYQELEMQQNLSGLS